MTDEAALAEALSEAFSAFDPPVPTTDVAKALLASDWLRAHDEAVLREAMPKGFHCASCDGHSCDEASL